MEDTPSSKKRSIMYSMKGNSTKKFNCAVSEGMNPIVVVYMQCCAKFERKIETTHNYSGAYIVGSETMLNLINMFMQWPLHKQKQANSSMLCVTMPSIVEFVCYCWN